MLRSGEDGEPENQAIHPPITFNNLHMIILHKTHQVFLQLPNRRPDLSTLLCCITQTASEQCENMVISIHLFKFTLEPGSSFAKCLFLAAMRCSGTFLLCFAWELGPLSEDIPGSPQSTALDLSASQRPSSYLIWMAVQSFIDRHSRL